MSILSAVFTTGRAEAKDARKQAEAHSIQTALILFHEDNGRMPKNYRSQKTGVKIACEGDGAYEKSMKELVTGGYLPTVPTSPGGSPYCYFDYGPGTNIGALFATALDSFPPWTDGTSGGSYPPGGSGDGGGGSTNIIPGNSCRPFPAVSSCDNSDPRKFTGCIHKDNYCQKIYSDPDKIAWCDSYIQNLGKEYIWLDPSSANIICGAGPSQDYCLCLPY